MIKITKRNYVALIFFFGFIALLFLTGCSQVKSTKLFEDGKKLLTMGKTQEALEKFISASRLNPKNHQIIESIGICYGKMNNYQKASEYFEKAVDLKPNSKLYLMNLAITYLKLDRYRDAKNIYYRVLTLDRDNKSALEAINNLEKMGY